MTRVRRDPDIELYDHACELLEAAAAVRRAVADPGASDAVPALLGCLETALRDLAATAEELEHSIDGTADRRRERAAHGFRNLHVALSDAAIAARVAQTLAARAAELR